MNREMNREGDSLTPGRNLYLLGTGTGLAPFLSIVRDPEVYERFEKVILVHGCRQLTCGQDEHSELAGACARCCGAHASSGAWGPGLAIITAATQGRSDDGEDENPDPAHDASRRS